MVTIIEYTACKSPRNQYPDRIISPPRSSLCCFTDMEAIGTSHQEGCWEYLYKRCRTCGFAVRVIVRRMPDDALLADLRRILATSFQRNVPNY